MLIPEHPGCIDIPQKMEKSRNRDINLIAIVGPTASGKTRLAAILAHRIRGEVVSADSRQVYRKMNIGTGKDYGDYRVEGKSVPVHLIDVVDAGYKYNLFEYQQDFIRVFEEIRRRNRMPVLCGGSGMYIEGVLRDYRLVRVPPDKKLREELAAKTMEQLTQMLSSLKRLHNITDTVTRKRLIRAIEIEIYQQDYPERKHAFPVIKPMVFGVDPGRDIRRNNITRRLLQRMESGMVDEVKGLLDEGVPAAALTYYGLEYKYITRYLLGELSRDEMVRQLETAIHRFAKRQMTWFRGMEKRGMPIRWLDGNQPVEEILSRLLAILGDCPGISLPG